MSAIIPEKQKTRKRRIRWALVSLVATLSLFYMFSANTSALGLDGPSCSSGVLCLYNTSRYAPLGGCITNCPDNNPALYGRGDAPTGKDQPVLQFMDDLTLNFKNNPTKTVTAGSSVHLQLGFNSTDPAGGDDVLTWTNITGGSAVASLAPSAGGFPAGCVGGGPSPVSSLPSKPYARGTSPYATSGNFSPCAAGDKSVTWTDHPAFPNSNIRHQLTINFANILTPATVCLRTHVSIGDYASLVGIMGVGRGDNGGNTSPMCFRVLPPTPPLAGLCVQFTIGNAGNWGPYATNTLVSISNVNPGVQAGVNAPREPNNGGTGLNGNGLVGNGTSRTFNYIPTNQSIIIYTIDYFHYTGPTNPATGYINNHWYPVPDGAGGRGTLKAQGVTCWHASCSVISVTGTGPGGYVMAGQPYTVAVNLSNDNTDPNALPIPSSYGGSAFGVTHGASYPAGFGLAVGETETMYYTAVAPASATPYAGAAAPYPDFPGFFALGSACPVGIPVYVPFTLEPHAYMSAAPTEENPTTITYQTWVRNPGSVSVYSPTTSTFTNQAGGGGPTQTLASATPIGPWPPGDNYILNGTYSPPVIKAGDHYCATISVAYTSGIVGPGGAGDVPVVTSRDGVDSKCFTVHNKPFFRVYGNNISSGGEFQAIDGGVGCTQPGTLGGWYNNSSGRYGSGTQLAALALSQIKAVASARSTAGEPTKLTFANNGPGALISTSTESPDLGGSLGDKQCLPLPEPPNTINTVGSAVSASGLPAGANRATGPVTLAGGVVNSNVSLFVNGDVRITGNITYNPVGWAIDKVPSFELVVTGGNIYIDPGVTELDGVYTAQNTATGGVKGKIYTCSSGFAPMPPASLFGSCNNQLTVYGAFVADDVRMMRTYGSLRDDRTGAPAACSNPGPIPPATSASCGAEVFNFSPELYLSRPAVKPPNNGGVHFDAFTSLPPIL